MGKIHLTRSERKAYHAYKEYLEDERKREREKEKKKEEEERLKKLSEDLDKSIEKWEKIALLLDQATYEEEEDENNIFHEEMKEPRSKEVLEAESEMGNGGSNEGNIGSSHEGLEIEIFLQVGEMVCPLVKNENEQHDSMVVEGAKMTEELLVCQGEMH